MQSLHRGTGVAGFAGLLLTWEVVARLLDSPAFPPVSGVVVALVAILRGPIWPHVLASARLIILGFSLAAVVGFALGTLAAENRVARAVIMPPVDAVRTVAALAIFPALIVLLGLGTWSKAVVIFWTAWPGVLLATLYGLTSLDSSVVEAARIDGAGRWHVLQHVAIPLASGAIMTGLRIGLGGGWISLVAAEMLGSFRGLGFYVLSSSQTFHFPEMYAGVVMIAVVGYAMNTLLLGIQGRIERRLFDAMEPGGPPGPDALALERKRIPGVDAGRALRQFQGL